MWQERKYTGLRFRPPEVHDRLNSKRGVSFNGSVVNAGEGAEPHWRTGFKNCEGTTELGWY